MAMIRNCILIMISIATTLLGALGSGPFVRTGIGFCGLYGTELSMVSTENHYRVIPSDSLMFYLGRTGESRGFVRPTFVIGWEQSLNLALSVSGGVGLAFGGISWDEVDVYNEFGNSLPSPPVDAALKMTYITIPIEAKLMLPLNSGGISVTCGPRLTYLASAKFENHARSVESDEYSLYNPFSWGVGGSVGGEVQLNKMDLLISLRFDTGLSNVSKDESMDLHNFTLYLDAGLRFTTNRHAKSPKWPL